MDNDHLLQHLEGEKELALGRKAIDLARRSAQVNKPQATDFLDPYERKVAKSVLGSFPEVGVLHFGGYKKAERARVLIYPRFYLTETIPSPIKVLEAKGNFSFAETTHRDFLGSLLATGLERGKIGDLLVLPQGCQVVVAREIADYLFTNWSRVRKVPIEVGEIDPQQLAVEPERIKEIKATVASLRLDAVAAEGFGTSRTKMVREIKSEKLKVNWKLVSNPALSVAQGDMLSFRGRGRVLIHAVGGKTRKGRLNLVLHRYY
ncbi:MAG: photosystem II S4 domain protein [Firmicutes bacterium]|nr:photosystem II S4 domain protein [Bacillota bacterium]